MKLIIGCANFGNFYGLKNKNLSQNKIFEIVKLAKKIGINRFDTANDYKDSERFLGNSIKKIFKKKVVKIDTKLSKKFKIKEKNKTLEDNIRSSIKRLNIKKINTLYIHEPAQLLKKNGLKLFKELVRLKKIRLITRIGVSVYTEYEIFKILNKFKIDVIQVPYNLLDRRFVNKKIIRLVKRKKCVLIARSIFLKGLLLKKNPEKIKFFSNWSQKFHKIRETFKKNNLTIKEWILYDLNGKNNFKNFIIGVSSSKQLKEIYNILKKRKKNTSIFSKLDVVDNKLIDPRKWKIN